LSVIRSFLRVGGTNNLRKVATLITLALAFILTFSPVAKEQRRCVRVVRVAGARFRRRVVVVIGGLGMVMD
jgi:hypothetical protein